MTKEVGRLRAEIDALLQQAPDVVAADEAALGTRRGDEVPEDLRRREDRLATIEAAMRRLEVEAKAVAEAERQRRAEDEAERKRTGKTRRGREPGAIVEAPEDKAQTNFTDPELSIMKTANCEPTTHRSVLKDSFPLPLRHDEWPWGPPAIASLGVGQSFSSL